VIEALRTVLTLRKMAGEEAARAAPYVHPRIGYVADDGRADPATLFPWPSAWRTTSGATRPRKPATTSFH
jgi:hypothetical protein